VRWKQNLSQIMTNPIPEKNEYHQAGPKDVCGMGCLFVLDYRIVLLLPRK
jgi:hypothetical protein